MTPREDAFQAILVRLSDTEAQLTEFKVAFEVLEELAAESRKTFDTQLAEAKTQLAAAEAARVEAEPDTEMVSLIREITDAHGAASVPFLDDAVKHAILTAEKRAEELEHRAEARLDCHAGPGTTEPACGGCISCLTRALEDAERETRRAQQRQVEMAEQTRDDYARELDRTRAILHDAEVTPLAEAAKERAELRENVDALTLALLASQQREAGLREALEGTAGMLDDAARLFWKIQQPPNWDLAARGAEAEAARARAALAAHQGAGATCDYCQAPAHPNHCDSWVCGRCGAPNPNPSAALSPAPAKTKDKET